MTILPDSGWIDAIRKIEGWVSAAITAAASVVLALAHFKVRWFSEISPDILAIIAGIGILFFFLFIFRVGILITESIKTRRTVRVNRRYKKLSDQQKIFLSDTYNKGFRNFQLPARYGTPRWLEELINWNYIEWHPPLIFTADSPERYSITEVGWQELDRELKK